MAAMRSSFWNWRGEVHDLHGDLRRDGALGYERGAAEDGTEATFTEAGRGEGQ